ncbi:hypothetical protein LMH66_19340 [Shewanella sp. 10N.7]|uniref:hypothetical protein n=2 Tax=Shewanella TaxID=22 RepID=UPI0026E406CB|nr:hypothetical protein [Shewanella sp. 1_MG-2023]MCC4834802.1 hypothetical protein [Shewanella sp. 10N.7]
MIVEVKVHCSHCKEHLMTNNEYYPGRFTDCECPSCLTRCEFTQSIQEMVSVSKWYKPLSWGKRVPLTEIKS